MSLLLDTNALLWAVVSPERLGRNARRVMEADGTILASAASLFEVAIKFRAGKLPVSPEQLIDRIERSAFVDLGIEQRHLAAIPELRLSHADPFDLLLVAQAQADSLTLLTADRKILAGFAGALDASQ